MARLFIGMPAFNAGPIIEAAIKSTYRYAEKIFVVDGSRFGPSTDDTAKIALGCGKKVVLSQGTFKIYPGSPDSDRMPVGAWDEAAQRAVYKGQVEPGEDCWTLLQDADEVWDDENMEKLMAYISGALPTTWAFLMRAVHFWNGPWFTRKGGGFDKFRRFGVYRNTEIVPGQEEVELPDVFFWHYGHALHPERKLFKAIEYLERGDYKDVRFEPHEWQRFLREYWNVFLSKKEGVEPFTGRHPVEVEKILDKIWTWI